MLGKALFGLDTWRVVGVAVSDSLDYFRNELRGLTSEAVRAFKLHLSESQLPIELLDGFIGEGYAIPYPRAVETIKLLARTEGILLDPTYTSKAMTGTIAAIREGAGGGIRAGAVPVFVHTGGAFGLMARRDLFQ
jgi:D-cysteine desulfhydrase